MIWIQTDIRLDPNQSEKGEYNLISGWFDEISKKFLCVYNGLAYNHPSEERLAPLGILEAQLTAILKLVIHLGTVVLDPSIGSQFRQRTLISQTADEKDKKIGPHTKQIKKWRVQIWLCWQFSYDDESEKIQINGNILPLTLFSCAVKYLWTILQSEPNIFFLIVQIIWNILDKIRICLI